MTEAPVAEVEVTREHRLATFRALYPDNDPGYVESWLETGDAYGLPTKVNRIAQAVAAACHQRDRRIAELEAEKIRHAEICTDGEEETPATELDRLNPYKRGWVDNPTPTEQPARFIHGVRYYLGMLEDGDSWDHSLGHIEYREQVGPDALDNGRKLIVAAGAFRTAIDTLKAKYAAHAGEQDSNGNG